jgi:hypothetical protein
MALAQEAHREIVRDHFPEIRPAVAEAPLRRES